MILDRGERSCYATYVVDRLLEEVTGSDVKLHILYDFTCVLENNLKSKESPDRYDNISVAVQILHDYGHTVTCQVKIVRK